MFSAVPDLNKRIAGWTIHPYGPKSRYGPIMDQAVRDTAKHGDTTLPFFITEYGISTDNGRCLDSNYNWPTCLTYQQAADGLHGAIADMRQTYGTRLAAMYIYSTARQWAPTAAAARSNFGALQEQRRTEGRLDQRDPERAEHLPRLTPGTAKQQRRGGPQGPPRRVG